jgi:hypothetical protein
VREEMARGHFGLQETPEEEPRGAVGDQAEDGGALKRGRDAGLAFLFLFVLVFFFGEREREELKKRKVKKEKSPECFSFHQKK